MATSEIFGLELRDEPDLDAIAVPVAALTVLKSLDADNEITWRIMRTDGLTSVEALGMARYATAYIEKYLLNGIEET